MLTAGIPDSFTLSTIFSVAAVEAMVFVRRIAPSNAEKFARS